MSLGIHTQSPPTAETLGAGLAQRAGASRLVPRGFDNEAERQRLDRVMEEGSRYRSLSLPDICVEVCRLEGLRDPVTSQAPINRPACVRAAVSGGTLTSIFTTSVNARLVEAFEQAGDSTQGWTMDAEATDFKAIEAITLGKPPQLKKLPRGGTAEHATISASQETYKIARYADQWVVDEQDVLDDRIGALSRVPVEMGLAARRLRPDLVYAILLANDTLTDGGALFNVTAETTAGGHANLGAAAFAALALRDAVGTFKKRRQDLVNLNLEARFLIVATELEMVARETLNSQQLMVAGTTDVDRGNHNVIADLGLQLRVDSRLSNGVVDPATGTSHAGTATGWYLSAAPSQAPTIEVAVLVGSNGAPKLNSWALTQGQWGVAFGVKFDIGAKALGYRGLYCGKA